MHRLLLTLTTLAVAATLWTPTPARADSVKLILNNPIRESAPLDKCDREVCTSLVKLINSAKKTIDFAIYGMRNQSDVYEALKRAKERGVRLRGVIDRDAEGKNYYTSTEDLVAMVGNVGSDLEAERRLLEDERAREEARRARFGADFKPRCERPEGFEGPLQCLGFSVGDRCLMAAHASREKINTAGAIMHNKYFVIDGNKVWMGSTNVSDSGTGGYNANLVVLVDNTKVAQMYTEEFEQMYTHGRYHDYKKGKGKRTVKVGRVTLDVLFSPQDKPITNAVRPLLQKAKKRIDVGIFFLTHKGIASDLMKAHERGVKVRVILDATASKNGYTKHELLRAAGVPVKVETWGGKMHMKSAVIDGEHVVTGSMNWTSAGEGGNDENTIVIHSKTHARQYERYFDVIWRSIPDTWLQGRPDPESRDSTTSCTDGVDNDYDHKADGEDPGCRPDAPKLPELPPHRFIPKEDGHDLVKVYEGVYYPVWHKEYRWIVPTSWMCSVHEAKDAGLKRPDFKKGRR